MLAAKTAILHTSRQRHYVGQCLHKVGGSDFRFDTTFMTQHDMSISFLISLVGNFGRLDEAKGPTLSVLYGVDRNMASTSDTERSRRSPALDRPRSGSSR